MIISILLSNTNGNTSKNKKQNNYIFFARLPKLRAKVIIENDIFGVLLDLYQHWARIYYYVAFRQKYFHHVRRIKMFVLETTCSVHNTVIVRSIAIRFTIVLACISIVVREQLVCNAEVDYNTDYDIFFLSDSISGVYHQNSWMFGD